MNTETKQERKDLLSSMEKQLRVAGQKLDEMWMEARSATGQAKTAIHKLIGPLREKHRVDREEHEALKMREDIFPIAAKPSTEEVLFARNSKFPESKRTINPEPASRQQSSP